MAVITMKQLLEVGAHFGHQELKNKLKKLLKKKQKELEDSM